MEPCTRQGRYFPVSVSCLLYNSSQPEPPPPQTYDYFLPLVHQEPSVVNFVCPYSLYRQHCVQKIVYGINYSFVLYIFDNRPCVRPSVVLRHLRERITFLLVIVSLVTVDQYGLMLWIHQVIYKSPFESRCLDWLYHYTYQLIMPDTMVSILYIVGLSECFLTIYWRPFLTSFWWGLSL